MSGRRSRSLRKIAQREAKRTHGDKWIESWKWMYRTLKDMYNHSTLPFKLRGVVSP